MSTICLTPCIAVRNAKQRCNGEIYNLGGGMERSISVIEMLHESSAAPASRCTLRYHDVRPGDQPLYITNTAKLEQQTGWRPRNSLSDTLESIYEFWRTNQDKIEAPLHSSPMHEELEREIA